MPSLTRSSATVPWIIVFAALLHAVQGVFALFDPAALRATPLSGLAWLGHVGAGALLLSATAAALWSVWTRAHDVWLVLPQQCVLVATAYTSGAAIWRQAYADGELRPLAFIAADQCGIVLLAIVHVVAIIDISRQTRLCESLCPYKG